MFKESKTNEEQGAFQCHQPMSVELLAICIISSPSSISYLVFFQRSAVIGRRVTRLFKKQRCDWQTGDGYLTWSLSLFVTFAAA